MQSYPVNLSKLLSFSLLTLSALAAILPAAVEAKSTDFFTCEQDKKEVFVTVVKNRNSGKTKELIRWESKLISNPKVKCREVSDRFQYLWSQGNLNYIRIGIANNNKTIICGLADKASSCNDTNKIFELSATNPNSVHKELLKKMRSERSDGGIYQASEDDDDDIIINIKASIEQRQVNRQ
ncbi:COP23 domain-containing protein [Chamaesiphon sp. GL140_3_metabinner_50]|uniref:COP23 domain-containing protein n=1 Tax=Chamaesiphon sp. GL140_3_metabinner_50 TaxID=2970812 RepID=UPI0025F72E31|nr:COP23 domain-containing protein [Chamaesiphon sp. GL140_3_metabinner_50]